MTSKRIARYVYHPSLRVISYQATMAKEQEFLIGWADCAAMLVRRISRDAMKTIKSFSLFRFSFVSYRHKLRFV